MTDCARSLAFYVGVLGFRTVYSRPEEGFAFLRLGGSDLMLDQNGLGRSFDVGDGPLARPFGRGMNLQIRVPRIKPLLDALAASGHPLWLAPEDRWYRKGAIETGNRQFAVADPDGYLLRFFQELGTRPCPAPPA